MTDLVPVLIPCPSGKHEEGDSVFLRSRLPLPGGIEARRKIAQLAEGASRDEVIGLLMDAYLRHGIASWTLHDDDGKDIALTRQSLQERILDDLDLAISISNRADDLYSPAVVAPLVTKVARSSQGSRPKRSTSASTTSTPLPRKRSKRSSTSTTPMAATATTTP